MSLALAACSGSGTKSTGAAPDASSDSTTSGQSCATNAQCTPPPTTPANCATGATQCSGALLQTCGSTSQWQTATACPAGQACNAGACVPGCYIAGAYLTDGAPNPADRCQTCQPGASTSAWSNLENGTSRGNAQVCKSGQCGTQCDTGNAGSVTSGTANPANPCLCCMPGTSTSGWTSTDGANASCPAGDVCNGNPASCTSGCWMDGDFYAPGATANGGCEVCTPASSTSAWTNVAGAATCPPPGGVCNEGSRQSGCYIDGTFCASSATNNSGCETCTPGTSTSAWVLAANGTSYGANDAECVGGACTAITTYTVGGSPDCVAFEDTNIWAASWESGNVTKLVASSGAAVDTYAVGNTPGAIVFAASNICVANQGDNTVGKLPDS